MPSWQEIFAKVHEEHSLVTRYLVWPSANVAVEGLFDMGDINVN